MLCAATELNFTLLLNKVAFLYLLNISVLFSFYNTIKSSAADSPPLSSYQLLAAISLS